MANCIIISIDKAKAVDKNTINFKIKTLNSKTEFWKGKPRNVINSSYKKSIQTAYKMVKNKVFLLRSGKAQGCLFLLVLLNIVVEVLARAIRQKI